MPNEKTRAYIYRILVAVGLLLAGYGVVSGEQLALWLGVVSATLNVLPAMNTTTKTDE